MRKLASIRIIEKLESIKDADNIELATIGAWKVVVAKNIKYNVGDKVVYCEIDSYLPIEPEFEFLRKTSYKKMIDGTEGFRLKTIRLRGQISQGLVIPLKDAIDIMKRRNDNFSLDMLEKQKDISSLLGITKWEPQIPMVLAGKAKSYFPLFIQKTDEERIQNLTDFYKKWIEESDNHQFYTTEKLDGSSVTFYVKDDEFGVCSRNIDLKETDDNTYWKVARELKIEEKLRSLNRNIAIQGELIGENIQKNRYNIKGHTVRFFNVFDIDNFKRVDYYELKNIIDLLELETVPMSLPGQKLPETVDELLTNAEGKSYLNPKTEREGLVIRSLDNKISFKVISNKFLFKNE